MSYELVETVEVGAGGAAAIDFQNIPQDALHLVVLLSSRSSDTDRFVNVWTNEAGGAYSQLRGEGNGTWAGGGTSQINIGSQTDSSDTASTFGNWSMYFANYTVAKKHFINVDAVQENNSTPSEQNLTAAETTSSAAITRIRLNAGTSFVQYSTASLYKITAD